MARYKINKTFRGSQTGAVVETFEKGTEAELSDDLAEAVKGSVSKIKAKKPETETENKPAK